MIHRIRKGISVFLAAASVIALSACGKAKTPTSFADGAYTGKSSVFEADESGNGAGYGVAEITIRDNRITACTFRMYEPDGTLKDDSYGAELSKENRIKAQKAVQAAEKYAQSLVENGALAEVDAISGATISYSEFQEAVNDALLKAAD